MKNLIATLFIMTASTLNCGEGCFETDGHCECNRPKIEVSEDPGAILVEESTNTVVEIKKDEEIQPEGKPEAQ